MTAPSDSPTLPVWWDDSADGPTNMALDELLAEESARLERPLLRFYAWSGTHVSLGGFQPLAAALGSAAIGGLPIVRRPSGGGAIIHGTDLTYAMAVPKSHPWGATPQALYDAVHAALVDVLQGLGAVARLHAGRPESADAPLLCFDRRAPGDVVAARHGAAATPDDPKILGSAQRRLGAVVLQHGSLLLAGNAAVAPAARLPGLRELGVAVAADGLATAWAGRIAIALGSVPAPQAAPFHRGREAEVIERSARFRDVRWTARR